MKKFLIFLTSIALLCGLCGCADSATEEATAPHETTTATAVSTSGQKLQLIVEPTGEAGFTSVPSEQLGAGKDEETTNGFTYTPILTNGEPSPGGSFTIDDVQLAPIRSDAETFSLYATRYFGFGELLYNNIMSDWVEYEVQQGDDVSVNVTSCSWYPHTCNLEVGILNLTGSDTLCKNVTGGEYSGTMTFRNVNAGTYIVYVRNLSSRTITDGSIRYSIS